MTRVKCFIWPKICVRSDPFVLSSAVTSFATAKSQMNFVYVVVTADRFVSYWVISPFRSHSQHTENVLFLFAANHLKSHNTPILASRIDLPNKRLFVFFSSQTCHRFDRMCMWCVFVRRFDHDEHTIFVTFVFVLFFACLSQIPSCAFSWVSMTIHLRVEYVL